MSIIRKLRAVGFKTKVVREMLREEKALSKIASVYENLHQCDFRWRDQTLAAALPAAFSDQLASGQAAKEADWEIKREELYAEIGKLVLNWPG